MPHRFVWISLAPEPPPDWDLRRCGWTMAPGEGGPEPRLFDRREATAHALPERPTRLMAALGVETGPERADLLSRGFGDALGPDIGLEELSARIELMAENAARLRRELSAGPVTLDLFHRDGRVGKRWLGLHPREFALLWHLAEIPEKAVSRADLLMEVWRLKHDPGTNSLEVHVSRLRSKIAAAGVKGLVETASEGGYRLSL